MRNTLICTVGTSLFGNLKNTQEETFKQAFEEKNWQKLTLLLLDKENTNRICGAEINSIARICEKKFLSSLERLIFLVSDTEDGKQTGEILKLYYNNSRNKLQFKNVICRELQGLRDDDVKSFKQQGLKSLVREISTEAEKFSPEQIAINATGGYKAQISFAGMIGQALGIPVYYLFERFSEVIELPPQPVALDLAFWLNNYPLFEFLETEQIIAKSEIKNMLAEIMSELEIKKLLDGDYIKSLIDEELIDEIVHVTLSAMGVLFNKRSRLEFAKQETTLLSLIPQDNTELQKKQIHLRDDHGKDKLQAFAEDICGSPYVKKIINSLPFNPKQTNPIRRTKPNGIIEFVITWTDQGLGLCIQTTGRNLAETNTIAIHLKEKYSK
ncbi:MAG: putative CRISPR-associated protein [Pelatocladus maniniholoensis HA4357-MV3]|jgi:putative CRISPR-associated protein (TIGR02619 family)|uniref:CRISPR-associated protein n=1 Tax=Pelatocladus maniniholoensis HA4357-MV3 TaxID=1117104 RepID=A0A9E3HC83_9NOST|nr:putative CRISPR-associated protein [Pelatocladus maniniholoensis HA4357-MV3]